MNGYGLCRYPMWMTGDKPTHIYCNERTELGRVYCDHHSKIAYVSKRAAPTLTPEPAEQSAAAKSEISTLSSPPVIHDESDGQTIGAG